jgi:predicted ATPase
LIFNNITLTHFKSIKNMEMKFAPITLLTGANGVGKSSLIQSMLLAKNTSENIHRFKRWEVELNGSYNLSLGRAQNVLSLMHEHNQIQIMLGSDSHQLIYTYDVDPINHPYSLQINQKLSSGDISLQDVNLHYLHAERLGPRKGLPFNPTNFLSTGFQGEFVNHAIDRADQKSLLVHKALFAESALPRFSTQVEAWMKLLIPDFRLQVKPLPDVDMVTIQYSNSFLGEYISPISTGFGITYALPIITSGLIASTEPNGLLIVENPEAHLHPYSQSRMGQYLALVSLAGVQVIVETHSEHVINGMRLQLALENKTENGLVYFFSQESGLTKVQRIEVNENGELSSWPNGFFDQEEKDLYELLRIKIQ